MMYTEQVDELVMLMMMKRTGNALASLLYDGSLIMELYVMILLRTEQDLLSKVISRSVLLRLVHQMHQTSTVIQRRNSTPRLR